MVPCLWSWWGTIWKVLMRNFFILCFCLLFSLISVNKTSQTETWICFFWDCHWSHYHSRWIHNIDFVFVRTRSSWIHSDKWKKRKQNPPFNHINVGLSIIQRVWSFSSSKHWNSLAQTQYRKQNTLVWTTDESLGSWLQTFEWHRKWRSFWSFRWDDTHSLRTYTLHNLKIKRNRNSNATNVKITSHSNQMSVFRENNDLVFISYTHHTKWKETKFEC